MRSAMAPLMSAGVITANIPWKIAKARCGMVWPESGSWPKARTIPRLNARRHLVVMVAPNFLTRSLEDPGPLERLLAALSGADADDLVQGSHEDLSVAELPRPRHLHDRVDRRLDQLVG